MISTLFYKDSGRTEYHKYSWKFIHVKFGKRYECRKCIFIQKNIFPREKILYAYAHIYQRYFDLNGKNCYRSQGKQWIFRPSVTGKQRELAKAYPYTMEIKVFMK